MGNLIVKSNALMEASYSLDVVEQRIILLFILQARELGVEITPLTKIKIYAESYSHYFGVTKEASYQALKQGVLGLHEQEFVFSKITGGGKKLSHYKGRFVDFIGYTDGEGSIELVLGSQIVPHILELQQAFTSYEIEQARGLNRYGLRLYELLIRWKSTGKLIINIDDLRAKMGLLKSEYQRIDNLKRRVIEPALKEINTHTDIEATYTQQKSGRKITGFTFEFKYKKGRKQKHETTKTLLNTPNALALNKKSSLTQNIPLETLTELEREAIAEANAYADKIEATPSHRKNLVKKALNDSKELYQDSIDTQEAKKAKQMAKEAQKQALEQTFNDFWVNANFKQKIPIYELLQKHHKTTILGVIINEAFETGNFIEANKLAYDDKWRFDFIKAYKSQNEPNKCPLADKPNNLACKA